MKYVVTVFLKSGINVRVEVADKSIFNRLSSAMKWRKLNPFGSSVFLITVTEVEIEIYLDSVEMIKFEKATEECDR